MKFKFLKLVFNFSKLFLATLLILAVFLITPYQTVKGQGFNIQNSVGKTSGIGFKLPVPVPPVGLPTSDPGKSIWDYLVGIYDNVKGMLYRAGNIAYKNALRTFLSRLAYDTATRLAEGNIGQSPLFNIRNMDAFVTDVGQTTLADTLDVLASTNGFFNFDVCQPQDINLRFAIHYSLFGNFNGSGGRGAPKCTLSQMAKTWTEWRQTVGRTYSSAKFLSNLREAFKPEQNDVGIYLTVESSIRSQVAIDKLNAQLDRIANQGFLSVTEKISGFIKTPAGFTSEQAKQSLIKNAPVSETISTGDIVADSIGIFTNTLASKLMKRLLDKGLVDGPTVRDLGLYNWANRQITRNSAAVQLAGLAQVNASRGDYERIIDQLTQCQDSANPGQFDCVMSSQIVGAIEQGLTVKEAIAVGQLNAAGLFGFKSGGNLDYRTDFPYRSLVIMRINRILPSSWELAALYNSKTKQEKSLQGLIDCYEDATSNETKANNRLPADCRQDMNGDDDTNGNEDYNPYYHLIDPNWVLKAPESFCAKVGSGSRILASVLVCSENNVSGTTDSSGVFIDTPICDVPADNNPDKAVLQIVRDSNYCADRKSCLDEDDSGKCIGNYGYCLKEDPIWRFQGQACDAVYASCETFTVGDEQASLIRDSLTPCDSGDVGCQWYATAKTKEIIENRQSLSWDISSKIYLNANAAGCPADSAGCTNLSRMIQGVNLIFNSDFELANTEGGPQGWQSAGNCSLSLARESFNNSNAAKVEADLGEIDEICVINVFGFIPIDSRFQLVLGGNAKADTAESLSMLIEYFAGNQESVGGSYSTTTAVSTGWSSFKTVLPDAPSAAEYAKVSFRADGNAWYDNLQLAVNKSFVVRHNNANYSFNPASYQIDYSQNSSYAKQFLKVAPDYLACDGYNQLLNNEANDTPAECFANRHYWRDDLARCVVSGDASCSNYTAVCSAEEVGCQGYTPVNGDPEVSARTSAGDVCAAECVGYETYLETPSFFDNIETPDLESVYQNFIPDTAQSCTAVEAGCEEFTNLDSVAQGGEGKEYFTELRQCISPNNPNLNFYYTWEGSDTTGFQLKKWSLLKSNDGDSPCTNIDIGTEDCKDDVYPQAVCNQGDLAANPDCRDFFNADSAHFYRLESKTVTASGECHPYRRTATGQVYNADPVEGKSCSSAVNNCREYKGNRGNNIRNIFSYDFEDGQIGGWLNAYGTTEALNISNEAVYQGGHSLRLSSSDNLLTHGLINLLRSGKQYTLSFWAKKGVGIANDVAGQLPELGDTLSFSQNGLTDDWRLYEIGPAIFNGVPGSDVQLRIQFNNLSRNEVIYLDNMTLKEYAESFYLVRNSWNTPSSCDAPYPGAQIGCQLYQDRQNQPYYLKSFDYLCGSTAIGCEAYLDTQNSTADQSSSSYQNNTVIANDQVIYLVNDPAKQCASQYQGCSLLGSPGFNRMIIDLTQDDDNNGQADALSGIETVAKLNNPDKYASILCSSDVEYCQNFEGDLTNSKPYISPLGAGGDRTCEYKGDQWVKSGTTEHCPGANGIALAKPGDDTYDGWVGTCPAVQSACTQFIEQNPDLYTNPNYYYLNNDDIDKQSCTSEDRPGGCISFRNQSLSATTTVKVKQDRKCSEWLECQTGVEIPEDQGSNNFACLSLIKCVDDGHGGKICANNQNNNYNYNLSQPGQADVVNQLTGYSRPGAVWNPNAAADDIISVSGYSSPELMSQIGQSVDIINPGFERYLNNNLSDPEGWQNRYLGSDDIATGYSNGNCSAILDTLERNVYSGRYSLKVTLINHPEVGEVGNEEGYTDCRYRSDKFAVKPGETYVLSFYAKSQNGGQKAHVGLAWYNANGEICDNTNGYCNNGTPVRGQVNAVTYLEIQPISNGWQKYVLSVGPNGEFPIPPQAAFARINTSSHNTYVFGRRYPTGSIWYDDFKIEPALSLNADDSNLTGKECRLYPTESAPACDYQDLQSYEGWQGFCLEPDPFYQADPEKPNNWDRCLQWYPVDTLQSDRLSIFDVQDIGYHDRAPLYYCLESSGNYNDYETFATEIAHNTYLEANSPLIGQDYQFRRPVYIHINDRDNDGDIDNVDDEDCGGLNFGDCHDGDVWGICACDTDVVINNTYDVLDGNSMKSEIDRIEWIVQKSSAGDWWVPGEKFVLERSNNWDTGTLRSPGNSFSVRANFNPNTTRLESFTVYMADRSDGNGGMWLAGVIHLREVCELVAQTVSNAGGQIKEKTVLGNYENWVQNNTLGFSRSVNTAPYGSFIAPAATAPDQWHYPGAGDQINAPIYVYQVGKNNTAFDFGPPASTSWGISFGRMESVCSYSMDPDLVGAVCATSDDCGESGICMGTGKRCYNTATSITNGQSCVSNLQCGSGYECRLAATGIYRPENTLTMLQNLYAKVYGAWKWTGKQYELCSSFNINNFGPDCGFNGAATDVSSADGITGPAIIGENQDITYLKPPGNLVEVKFTINGSQDQLPLDGIWINWGDGSSDYFRGPLDYRPDMENPYKAYHIYSCETDDTGACVSCSGNISPASGTCTYEPIKAGVKNHWGWCNNRYVDEGLCEESDLQDISGAVIIDPRAAP